MDHGYDGSKFKDLSRRIGLDKKIYHSVQEVERHKLNKKKIIKIQN